MVVWMLTWLLAFFFLQLRNSSLKLEESFRLTYWLKVSEMLPVINYGMYGIKIVYVPVENCHHPTCEIGPIALVAKQQDEKRHLKKQSVQITCYIYYIISSAFPKKSAHWPWGSFSLRLVPDWLCDATLWFIPLDVLCCGITKKTFSKTLKKEKHTGFCFNLTIT